MFWWWWAYTWIVSFFQNKIHLHSHQKIRNVFLSDGLTSGKNNCWDSAELWSAPAGICSYFIIFQYTDNPFNEPFLHFKGKNKPGQYIICLFGRGCTCYVEIEQTERWSISLRDQSKLTADCKCCFMLEFLTATAWSQRRVLPPAERLSSEPTKNERLAKSKTMCNLLGKSDNSCLNVETAAGLCSAQRKCSFSCNNCQHFKNQSATAPNFAIPNYTLVS